MTDQEKTILKEVVDSNFIFSLAVSSENSPFLITAFYITDDNVNFYFKSRTASNHSTILAENDSAAISIYQPKSNYSVKSGIQGLGVVERVKDIKEMAKVVGLYGKKFAGSEKKFFALPELVSDFVSSTMYKFILKEVKVMDSAKGYHAEEYVSV